MQKAQRHWSWVPGVRHTHPNFFTVLAGELLVHTGLGVAGIFGAHNSPIWYFLDYFGSAGFYLLGGLHLAIAAMMLVGLYLCWSWMRTALLASVTLYILQTSFLVAGIIRTIVDPHLPQAAYEGAFYGIGLILLSTAAYKEPVVPGRYNAPDTV